MTTPRLAARLNAVSAADVIDIGASGGKPVVTRPVYGGKMLSSLTIDAECQAIITYRPGAFRKAYSTGAKASIEAIPGHYVRCSGQAVKGLSQEETAGSVKLEEVEIIVSGGRGLKEPDNFAMVEQLASALNGVVGASRAVVDAGWRKHHEQVGQTGRP